MKNLLTIILEFLKVFRKAYLEIRKKKREGELEDVRKTIKELDLNKLRDSILPRR